MGDALAAFMLGTMNDYTQSANLQNATRATVLAFYVQDSIRVSPRLTLNAGLRWDPTLTPYDYFDRGETFSQAAFDAGRRSTVYTNAPAGLLFYGDPGIPRGFQNHHLLNLSPRVGLAWDPTGSGRQTIRVSSALLRDSEEMFYNERQTTNAPYGTSIDQPYPGVGALTNPWANYTGGSPFPLPTPIPKTFNFPSGGSYVGLPLDMAPTYMIQWSLSYQRQFGKDWMASATYIGNKTTHVWAPEDMNPATYDGSSASTNLRRRLYLQNPTLGAAYAQYTFSDQNGNANYNAMLLSLQHRFSQNFSLLTNYTWSHCISDMDFRGELSTSNAYQNPYNRAADRGNCGFDLRHQMNTSLVAVSPARGNAFARRILGNWQLSPIVSIRTGLPMLVGDGTDISQTGINIDRPNLVSSDVYLSTPNPVNYLNRLAFATQAAGTFGNLGRDTVISPGVISFDLALSRTFHFGDRWQWQWRFEAFNVINHTNFNAPNLTLSNNQFGVISSARDPRILQFAMKLNF